MTKLIGTNPNQVPSNADLGTAAFMDKKEFLLSKGSSLSAIDAVIPNTAVDVFIYDTSKDSDGGAWRKRTQHTSWYNERLNTTTRGSRREFPVVAVIVAESARLTIYDGDDLSMWMVFDLSGAVGSASNMIPRGGSGSESSITSVAFLNAKLIVGLKGAGNYGEGPIEINFIPDFSRVYREVGSGFTGAIYDLPISGRNSNGAYKGDFNELAILVQTVNDVAMTVLPNAPIDSATGLPIPTIAVATNSGVSVIKDDGTVVDITHSSATYTETHYVILSEEGTVTLAFNNFGGTQYGWVYTLDIPSSDTVITVNARSPAMSWFDTRNPLLFDQDFWISNTGGTLGVKLSAVASKFPKLALGTSKALTNTVDNLGTEPYLFNYISATYNTGWMNGNIKLATLSDTDATDVTGSELITNGSSSFSGTSGWYLDNANQSSGTIATLVETSGQLIFTHSDTNSYWDGFGTSISTVVGKSYTVTVDIAAASNMNVLRITDTASQHDTDIATGGLNTAGTYSYTFTAISTTTYLHWNSYSSSGSMTLNSMTVRLAEEDRSVNGNGLQVFGTVTKNPVATGADLVAYSGFNGSGNYLKQPYNSGFNFGTNDFSVSAWIQLPTINSPTRGIICEREGSSGFSWQFFQYNSRIYFYVGSTSSPAYTAQILTEYDKWYHVVAGVRSGKIFIYVNGVQDLAVAGTPTSVTSTNAVMTVGVQTNTTSEPFTGGKIALLKVSGTAPGEEQIKKIYEDEKVLFQENAKATLYGTSDAVTALAYDDSTNLLHAGTSAGRSVFQGLRRVDNTTRAVGTAISAVDGFVVEE